MTQICVTGIRKTCEDPSKKQDMPAPTVEPSGKNDEYSFFDSTLLTHDANDATKDSTSLNPGVLQGPQPGNIGESDDDSYQGDMDEQELLHSGNEDDVNFPHFDEVEEGMEGHGHARGDTWLQSKLHSQ